jgi:hypothetical protein
VNCLLAGAPAGTTLDMARVLLAADPAAPVTLLSDDTEGLLAVLDQPGLTRCEVLWADAASPATVDDALVHRRMLHGPPDVVIVVVDEQPGAGEAAWTLGAVLVPRLFGTPLVVTGSGVAALAPVVTAFLEGLADEVGQALACVVVPGCDPDVVLRQAADLVRTSPAPQAVAAGPPAHGHCAH